MKTVLIALTLSIILLAAFLFLARSGAKNGNGGFMRMSLGPSELLYSVDFATLGPPSLRPILQFQSNLYFADVNTSDYYQFSLRARRLDSIEMPFTSVADNLQIVDDRVFWTTRDNQMRVNFSHLGENDTTAAGSVTTPPFSAFAAGKNRILLRIVDPSLQRSVIVSATLAGVVTTNSNILEPQVDGIFCTDGMMHACPELNSFVYIYFYRNQYLRIDDDIEHHTAGRTIDTNALAKISTSELDGSRTLSSPAKTVNRLSTVSGKRLLIQSNALSDGEFRLDQRSKSHIDVYDLHSMRYQGSTWVDHAPSDRPRRIFATADTLVVIFRNAFAVYRLPPAVSFSDTTSMSTGMSSRVKLIPNLRRAVSKD